MVLAVFASLGLGNFTAAIRHFAAMRGQRRKQNQYLNRLAAIVRKPLEMVMRKKLVALITVELHHRDIMERLIRWAFSLPQPRTRRQQKDWERNAHDEKELHGSVRQVVPHRPGTRGGRTTPTWSVAQTQIRSGTGRTIPLLEQRRSTDGRVA